MVIYTRLIQSIRVLSEYDYISVSWLLLHICHNFHFLERSGDPNVYLFHHDLTLMAWPLIWYYLIDLYMFIWVVTGQGPHQGHWALCCLWVRVMLITSIHVKLYIRPCILVCALLYVLPSYGHGQSISHWTTGSFWQVEAEPPLLIMYQCYESAEVAKHWWKPSGEAAPPDHFFFFRPSLPKCWNKTV